jgi:hypothetical protein
MVRPFYASRKEEKEDIEPLIMRMTARLGKT